MVSWKAKLMLATLAVATLGPVVPQEADACLFGWCRRRAAARVAYYGGMGPQCCGRTTVGFAPNPCCNACPAPCTTTQRVCNYVPQTCYRTVYRQVPVTVYRPTTTCDPCTGCPRTVMQPCTTVQHVAQRVPVTTYRQVCRMVQRPVVPACNPCATAAPVVQNYAPVQVQQYAAPAPNCCGTSQAATVQSYAQTPMAQPYTPAPATQLSPVPQPTPAGPSTNLAPQQGQNGGAAATIPSLPNSTYQAAPNNNYQVPQSGTNNQFQGSSTRTTAPFQPRVQNPDIRPLPDLHRTPPVNPNDRTASRVEAGTIMQISWQTSAEPEPKVYSAPAKHTPANSTQPKTRRLDAGGWMPASTF